jgi:hypothetical protein
LFFWIRETELLLSGSGKGAKDLTGPVIASAGERDRLAARCREHAGVLPLNASFFRRAEVRTWVSAFPRALLGKRTRNPAPLIDFRYGAGGFASVGALAAMPVG